MADTWHSDLGLEELRYTVPHYRVPLSKAIVMKAPFKRFVIAATGDFGEQRTHAKMKHWIEENGGKFATKITPDVTHLVCSVEHFKRSSPMGKALNFGRTLGRCKYGVHELVDQRSLVYQARKAKGLSIVNFDWLEDSLMQKSPKREGGYLLSRRIKAEQKAKAEKAVTRKENVKQGGQLGYLVLDASKWLTSVLVRVFKKGCMGAKSEVQSDGYHVYRDSTGFVYDIILARVDLSTNKNERYNIKIFESHAVPKLYACSLKYTGLGQTHHNIIIPVGSPFDMTFAAFKKTFLLYTKKEWEQRFDINKRQAHDEDENNTEREEGETAYPKVQPYVYTPPRPGQPQGF